LNKALLDTNTLSEIGKGINPTIASNATAYRLAFGHYTTSVVTVMEIIRGFQGLGAIDRKLLGRDGASPGDRR
jgi:tRNA(fMet)-specific endonuclease VapC